MRALGLDLGTRTLGISMSDNTETIATAVTTIRFEEGQYTSLLPQIEKLIQEYPIGYMVLGFPKNMNNSIGERGETTLEFKEMLSEYCKIPVFLQDERLSTVEATHYLIEADMSRKKRKKKVDSIAANIILQTYLDKKKGIEL